MEGDNEIGKGNALIRFYRGKDPKKMSDKKWAQTVAEIQYCLQVEKRLLAAAIADYLPPQ